ncbi:MAG: methyltransferase domain-containing protein [Planctomycetota bacterium]|nr:methyltransferase domain-containing protein [Planctomycetota bacterium]MDA1113844.1 methyltransferase domain-containing protein [Planctomycetota bacterium]
MESNAYLLGTAIPELQRLELQNELWSSQTEALWNAAGFGPGQHILELGCGPGFSSLALAQRVGETGKVLGWDRSQGFLDHLAARAEESGLPWLETFQGDVLSSQNPALEGSMDGVFSRWLLCWMKRPMDAIETAHKALRKGGKIVLFDYFHYRSLDLLPHNDAFRHGLQAVENAWYAAEGNPDVGTILPNLVEEAGFEIEHCKLITRYAKAEDPLWQWPMSFFPGFMRQLAVDNYLTTQEAEDFLAAFRASEKHPNGLFLAPPMLELVAVKR